MSGRAGMESILGRTDHVDLIYSATTSAAYGAYYALKAPGKGDGTLNVAADGDCSGVRAVKNGIIGAMLLEYPDVMATNGVVAVAEYIKSGKRPESVNAGAKLVTDRPVQGVPSISAEEGLKQCWG